MRRPQRRLEEPLARTCRIEPELATDGSRALEIAIGAHVEIHERKPFALPQSQQPFVIAMPEIDEFARSRECGIAHRQRPGDGGGTADRAHEFGVGQRRAPSVEQLLVMTHDAMRADLPAFLDAVCDFIGVARFEDYPENRTIRPQQLPAPNGTPDPSDIAYLNALYREDIVKTETLAGLDLSGWRTDG